VAEEVTEWWWRPRLFVVILAVLAVLVAIGLSIEPDWSDGPSPSGIVIDDRVEVIYEVTGTASGIDITIQNPSGNTEQHNDLSVPLGTKDGRKGLHMTFRSGDFAYLSAQNTGESGSVTCRIVADGVVIESATSRGAYVIASCSGLVP
jgi:hypothetical protein